MSVTKSAHTLTLFSETKRSKPTQMGQLMFILVECQRIHSNVDIWSEYAIDNRQLGYRVQVKHNCVPPTNNHPAPYS